MEERTSLIVGGIATLVASAVVVCAVAFTNTAALGESPGEEAGAGISMVPIVEPPAVPADGGLETADEQEPTAATGEPPAAAEDDSPSVTDTPAPSADQTGSAPPVGEESVPEVVPAPAPEVVARTPGASSQQSLEEILDDAMRERSWEDVRRWAAEHGWPQQKAERWIARLDERRDVRSDDADRTGEASLGAVDEDARTSEPQGSEQKTAGEPTQMSLRDAVEQHAREATEKTTAARSGASDRGTSAADAAKDRSRVSPDRRDR